MEKLKKLLALLLALCMVLSLTACGEDEETGRDRDDDGRLEDREDKDEASEEETEEVTEPARWYPAENVLMYDDYNWSDDTPLYGNADYIRGDIVTVTFLDTLADVPGDAWDVSAAGEGKVMAWVVDGCHLYIAGEGGVTANPDCSQMFMRYYNLTEVSFNDCFYTDEVTTMMGMFSECENLTGLDLSFFNTGKVRNMAAMFQYCESLVELDISGFDTSNVVDMQCMFYHCTDLTALDLSHFDTADVTDMYQMFCGCKNLVELDISSFDTSSNTTFMETFYGCESLTSLDLSHFDTSNVDDMAGMFNRCSSLTFVDLSGFDTSNVGRFQNMFYRCGNLTSVDLSGFDFSRATSAHGMFRESGITDIGCSITLPEGCSSDDMFTDSPME